MTRSRPQLRLLLCLSLGACQEPEATDVGAPPSIFEAQPQAPPTVVEPPESATQLNFETLQSPVLEALVHHAGRHPDKWIAEIMSGGVALVDLNRDGALDLLLVDSGSLEPTGSKGAAPQLLFGDGKGGFSPAEGDWVIPAAGYGMGVAAGDVDGDGWTDLYLTSYDGRDRLLLNAQGRGWEDATEAWGLAPAGWSTSAAFFDLEGDGDLDLYVGRYIEYSLESSIKCWYRAIHVYCTPNLYPALPDRLYVNEGGRFVERSLAESLPLTKTLALATGDLDDDGDVDVYVASDTSQNLLLRNDGKGQFDESGIDAGVAFSKLGREEASMGVAVADSDADGLWDLAVTNFQSEATSLYARRPQGHYRERSDAAGIGASSRARLSFGIEWLDADNDGDEDLLVANGHIADNVASYREQVSFAQPNSLYRQLAPGEFEDQSARAGTALAHAGVSRGLAVGDIDADGGVDYVVVDNDGPVQVAVNRSPERGHWLQLWLDGPAIGAQVELKVGDRTLRREVRGSSSYLSVSSQMLHFGLGEATSVEGLTLRWPDGRVQELGTQTADQFLRIKPGEAPEPFRPGEKRIDP